MGEISWLRLTFGLFFFSLISSTIIVGVDGAENASPVDTVTGFSKVKSFVNHCNETVKVNGTGVLTIDATVKNGSCVWEVVNPNDTLAAFAVEEIIRLDGNDVVNITQADKPLLTLTAGDIGSKLGLFFIRASGDYKITLTLSANSKNQRVFGVKFILKNNTSTITIPFSVEEHEVYHIPLTNISNGREQPQEALQSLVLDVSPKGASEWNDKKMVIEVEENEGKVNYSCDSTAGKAGFDCLADKPATHLSLTFNNYDFRKSRLTFTMDLVDDFCSKYLSDGKATEFSLDTNNTEFLKNRKSLNCLTLINLQGAPARLDFSNLFKLLGPSDLLTIHDGGREFDSDVVLQINNGNVQDIKSSVLNTYVKSSNLRISYTSHYFGVGEAVKIGITPDWLSKVNVVEVDTFNNGSIKHPLFVFTSNQTGSRTSFKSTTTILKTDVNLYSSIDASAKPFAVLPANKKLPDLIVSPTNVLRIEPQSEMTASLKGAFGSYNGASATFSGDGQSLVLTTVDSLINSSYWFIPGRPLVTSGIFELSIERLVLPHEGACLTVDQLSENKQTNIVSECFSAPNSSLDSNNGQRNQYPLINLKADNSYLLTYSLGNNSVVSTPVLFSGSVYVVQNTTCGGKISLNENALIEPASYPGVCPLAPKDSLIGTCKWLLDPPAVNGSSALVHMVFQDLDLKGDQLFGVQSPNFNPPLLNSSTTTIPDDILTDTQSTLTLQSALPTPVAGQSLRTKSGRGFRAIVSRIDCGGYIDLSKTKTVSTPGYPNSFNGSRCLWKVENTAAKGYPIIQLSHVFGANPAGNWSAFANLSIYDNPNTRELRFMNLSNPIATVFNSSLSIIYIEYKLLDVKKPAPGVQFNFTSSDCANLHNDSLARVCENTPRRCVLPEWICNGHNNCGDNTDEIQCNTLPTPVPAAPVGGVSGWVIVLVIIPMSIGVGVLLTLFGPLLWSRVRGGRYSEFRNFAEDT